MPRKGRSTRGKIGSPDSAPSPQTVLASAIAIIERARDAELEIDWTDNPKNDREAAIRRAIMQITAMEARKLSDFLYEKWENPYTKDMVSANHIRRALENLCDAEEIGEDLWDEIEAWRTREIESRAREERAQRQILLDKARRSLGMDGTPAVWQ